VVTLERLGVEAIRDTIMSYRDSVRAHAATLNRLNVYPVPDGDTGSNMASTLDAVVAELAATPSELSPTCQAIAHGSLMGARGNSGIILSQILRGVTSAFETAGDGDPRTTASALAAGAAAAYAAVLRPMEGTILTVVREAAAAAERTAQAGGDLVAVLAAARARGFEALERTPELLPVLKSAGVVDAGGAGFLLLLDAALHVVDGRPVPEPDDDEAGDQAPARPHGSVNPDVSDLRYEVMYFLDLADAHIDEFRQAWGAIGDSIVVVGGDGLWNCHVHTNDIGVAIEVGLAHGGRPSKISVTDLFDQVASEHAAAEPSAAEEANESGHLATAGSTVTSVVAVGAGDGLRMLFGRLGVACVVTGGAAMNPSTAELLDAVEAAPADEVVLLPNHRNVVPVAEQVDGLTTKHVVVVPTRSPAEALAALAVFDPVQSVHGNQAAMLAACDGMALGEVTQAVRSASSSVGPIAAGDWLGLTETDGVVVVASSVGEAAVGLLDAMVADHEVVSVIEGVGATSEVTESVVAWLGERRPDATVDVYEGGQPFSAYLFGAEP